MLIANDYLSFVESKPEMAIAHTVEMGTALDQELVVEMTRDFLKAMLLANEELLECASCGSLIDLYLESDECPECSGFLFPRCEKCDSPIFAFYFPMCINCI